MKYKNSQGEWINIPTLKGKDGITYTPHVTAEGVLSWTNDGDVENPAPINIKSVDKSLTVEGQAADAKAVGDKIVDIQNELNSNILEVKTSVSNIHTHSNKKVIDGITADKISEWNANTTDVANLKNTISTADDAIVIGANVNKYYFGSKLITFRDDGIVTWSEPVYYTVDYYDWEDLVHTERILEGEMPVYGVEQGDIWNFPLRPVYSDVTYKIQRCSEPRLSVDWNTSQLPSNQVNNIVLKRDYYPSEYTEYFTPDYCYWNDECVKGYVIGNDIVVSWRIGDKIEIMNDSNNKTYPFRDFASLKSIDLTNAKGQASQMFAGLSLLKSVIFGEAFFGDSSNSIYGIFDGCSSLTSVDWVNFSPRSVDLANAFRGCSSLQTVDLRRMDGSYLFDATNAFANCASLSLIDFGETFDFTPCVSMTNMFAGLNYSDLTLVIRSVSTGEPMRLNSDCGLKTPKAIYVPDAYVEQYKASSQWSAFASVIKPLSAYQDIAV